MQWNSTHDSFYTKGTTVQVVFPSVNSAVQYAIMMGWGYSVSYPKYKNHTKKNYADNFKYKGPAKEEVEYD